MLGVIASYVRREELLGESKMNAIKFGKIFSSSAARENHLKYGYIPALAVLIFYY
jgi:hypothetical protein